MRHKEGNKEKAIIEAAIETFAEDGFYKSKIVDIAEKANVAIGSIYVYYKNKDDILLKIFDQIWEPIYNDMKRIASEKSYTPTQKFEYMLDSVFDAFEKNPEKAVVFVNEQNRLMKERPKSFTNYYELFIKEGEKIIKSGIKSSEFKNLNVRIFRRFVLGGLRELLREWTKNPTKRSLNQIRDSVKYFCKTGILDK